MLKTTEVERRELMALRGGAVHAYLARSLESYKDTLVNHSDTDTVRLVQGYAQSLRGLLELIDPESFSTNGKRG